MTEIISFGSSRQPHYGSGLGGKQTTGFSEQKVAPVSKRKSTDWPFIDINTQGSSGVTRMGCVCGSLGNFGPDCLESLTSGAYTLEGSLFSIMVLCRLDMEPGGSPDA